MSDEIHTYEDDEGDLFWKNSDPMTRYDCVTKIIGPNGFLILKHPDKQPVGNLVDVTGYTFKKDDTTFSGNLWVRYDGICIGHLKSPNIMNDNKWKLHCNPRRVSLQRVCSLYVKADVELVSDLQWEP